MKKKEMVEALKTCIDKGHDFELIDTYNSYSGRWARWKCSKCDYVVLRVLSEEEKKTVKAYENLNYKEIKK